MRKHFNRTFQCNDETSKQACICWQSSNSNFYSDFRGQIERESVITKDEQSIILVRKHRKFVHFGFEVLLHHLYLQTNKAISEGNKQ